MGAPFASQKIGNGCGDFSYGRASLFFGIGSQCVGVFQVFGFDIRDLDHGRGKRIDSRIVKDVQQWQGFSELAHIGNKRSVEASLGARSVDSWLIARQGICHSG